MHGSTTNLRMSSFVLPILKCTTLWLPALHTLTKSHSYYKALTFYLQEHPTLLNDFLSVLIPRIDHSRVVRMFSKMDHIPLIRSYLIAVQHVSDLRCFNKCSISDE